jgi:integrase
MRHQNHGLKKRCRCRRKDWPKCAHGWHLNFTPRGGQDYRLSLDVECGRHIDSKTEAEIEATRIKGEILAATFVCAAERRKAGTIARNDGLTLEGLGAIYFATHTNHKTGKPLSKNERYRWDLIMRTIILRANGQTVRFGALDVGSVTRHDIEAFKAVHSVRRTETFLDSQGRQQTWHRGGPVGVNRCLGRLRAFYSWAVKADHVSVTPFKKGTESIIEMFTETKRERRLHPAHGGVPGEQERVFSAANPHLQALIVAALETACRIGELLSLQWRQVRWDLNEIHLPAKKTKAIRRRDLPMSQALQAVLQMRRHDPAGNEYPPEAYVFGNVTGERVKSVKTAWQNAVLKAHGIEPMREKNGKLTADCQLQLADIDLKFHDLRREAGSSLLEHGMAPHYVQAFLDHANLSTTSRYLNITAQGMHAALKGVEAERRIRCTPVAHTPDRPINGGSQSTIKSLQ